MSSIPNLILESLWTTLVAGNDVTMQAVDSSNDYDLTTSQFLGDVTAGSYLGDPEILTGVTFTAGSIVADPAPLANIMAAQFVAGVIVYADTGSPATSSILAFIDKNADNTTMNKEGDGSPMTAEGPGGLIARI